MDLFRRLLCGIRSALCPEQHESPDSDHGIRVLEYHSDDSRARSPFACGSGSRAHEAVEIGQVFVRCHSLPPEAGTDACPSGGSFSFRFMKRML